MRTFTRGSGPGRKVVVIEVNGSRIDVTETQPDGSTKRGEKHLSSDAQARSVSERMAGELLARGFVEQAAPSPSKAQPAAATPSRAAAKGSAARAIEPAGVKLDDLFDEDELAAPALPRLAPLPVAGPVADGKPRKKKKSGGRKPRPKPTSGDGLDKRVIAGAAMAGVALIACIGFFIYDALLRPPSIIGTWKGSRTEHEISRFLTHTEYHLVLDDRKHAALTLQGDDTSTGTYTLKGDRLKLNLKDREGEGIELQYRIVLGHATLDLFDPSSGKKLVQLIRLLDQPTRRGTTRPPELPKDLAAGAGAPGNPAADERLASVAFTPKDGAFKLRHPSGWKSETGSRPDNTYSWARFTRGSAKIQVFADVAGSLMSGSDVNRPQEEGSEFAPVHLAHQQYKRTVAEEYSDYQETAPALFKGSALGEGRLSAFNATEGGFLGSKFRGYRVTLLTNDRRITVLCQCPPKEFEALKPTFLAVCRSVAR